MSRREKKREENGRERDVELEIGRERGGRNGWCCGVVMMRGCDDDRIVLFVSCHVVGNERESDI